MTFQVRCHVTSSRQHSVALCTILSLCRTYSKAMTLFPPQKSFHYRHCLEFELSVDSHRKHEAGTRPEKMHVELQEPFFAIVELRFGR